MNHESVYLDNNATTEPLEEVRDGIMECLAQTWANPSSIHRAGFAARSAIELARESVARLVNADPGRIVFTSGGTESANLAITGVLSGPIDSCSIISSPLEHSAVSVPVQDAGRRGAEVSMVSHDLDGRIDMDDLEGRNIMSPGPQAQWLRGTGAVIADGSLPEAFQKPNGRWTVGLGDPKCALMGRKKPSLSHPGIYMKLDHAAS